ncbi:type I-MYXAN CRISPR-associated protein Cas6/Cmx6 [Geminocystis sp. GBBB08]|uniref:type I-MYXAN CRISPR-associated protein Cas6/Cmx6 n=1 Tax=Geminocystis sp. GBBB08 TaxID=2604140 RepID=UPI0027E2C93B|nr:type I-MYXAN CRISPR-associated protein Cas6/Cmx6 [Geminocystis sp. GBBB08]MBL1210682.1 type I-MYXAN CRISPR-associated protein Cas6/Cmx6 [Geminocystis sp. GBBB08]
MEFLEIQFSLRGKTLPADHGYALYSAIKNIDLEKLKTSDNNFNQTISISSISGIPDKKGVIYLNQESRFRLRCPAEDANKWYRYLQNQVLDLRGHLIRLIKPQLTIPQSSKTLKSRLVTFKLEDWNSNSAPTYFLQSCQKALSDLEIKGTPFIDSNEEGDLALRALKIKGRNCLGYGVIVEDLNDDDSLKLQCYGLGGRKHFGCGWFYPTKEVNNAT